METSKKIDILLKEHFSLEKINIQTPAIESFEQARMTVSTHKKYSAKHLDVFTMIASFLNLKIKLYHAVVVLGMILTTVILLNKQPKPEQPKLSSSEPSSSLVAVKNSTVLSCIQTFVSPK